MGDSGIRRRSPLAPSSLSPSSDSSSTLSVRDCFGVEGVGVLLEGTPANVDLVNVRDRLNTLSGVAGVHDLHAWSLTSGRNALSVHLVRDGETAHDDLLVRAQRLLTGDLHFWHVTIQVESADCGAYETHL
jgi:cobalt-zinc-cadmium efflux system protein